MSKVLFSILFISVISLFPYPASSGDVEQLFEQLKDSGEDYRPEGSICEQVARLDLARDYPAPTFEVTTGITYAYANDKKILGELDVIVFDTNNNKAVLISEVKCWKDLKSAHQKAQKQRRRFQDAIESKDSLKFSSAKKSGNRYDEHQFRTPSRFIAISQEGGKAAGFDSTLDFSLEELAKLRLKLLSCQERGECKRPHE